MVTVTSARPGGSRRRAREDDVFHLSAAQGFGSLLPHHPRQGIDHVGLARAVGADDRGDARLETKNRIGEAKDLKPFSVRLLRYTASQTTAEIARSHGTAGCRNVRNMPG